MSRSVYILFWLGFAVLASSCKEHDLGLGLSKEVFNTPVIQTVTPNQGGLTGGTQVTIVGSGFTSGLSIYFGADPCGSVLVSSTKLYCVTPSSTTPGSVNVTVVNPTGASTTAPSAFTYVSDPTVTSISPTAGNTSGGIPVTITGTGFVAASSVSLGSANCTSVNVVSSTTITCVTSTNGTGYVDVVVTSPSTQYGRLVNGFLYQTAPSVVSSTPNRGFLAGGITVSVLGAGFAAGASVTIGGISCTPVTFVSSSQLDCTAGANAAGVSNIVVTNPDTQIGTLVGGFTYATDAFTQMEQFAGAPNPVGVADGAGSAARFYNPSGVVLLGGYLYIADTSNSSIRRMDLATNIVTTFVGVNGLGGSNDGVGSGARFSSPSGLTTDGTDLYTCDTGYHTIRKITVATATVTTIAGTAGAVGTTNAAGAAARFSSPDGIIFNANRLFIADRGNHSIRQMDLGTTNVTTLAGTGACAATNGVGVAAAFCNPWGVTTDGTSVFVADYSNHAIRRIDIASGTTTTFVGTMGAAGGTDAVGAAARFNGPINIGINPAFTQLIVTDYGGSIIRSIDIASTAVTTLAGTYGSAGGVNGTGPAARFWNPRAVFIDGTNAYIPEVTNTNIRKVVLATGVTTTIAGVSTPSGYIDSTGTSSRFTNPRGIGLIGNQVFTMDYGNCLIRQVDLSTRVTSTPVGVPSCTVLDGTGIFGRVHQSMGLRPSGTSFYFAEYTTHYIRQYDSLTNSVTTLAGSGAPGTANGVGAAAQFTNPSGVTSDGTYVYIADYSNHVIRRLDPLTGTVITFAGTMSTCGWVDATGTSARFCNPMDLDTDGTNLYVVDRSNHTIRKIVIATQAVTTFASGGNGFVDGVGLAARLSSPVGITYDGSTYLFVADYGNHAIRKIHIGTTAVSTVLGLSTTGTDPGSAAVSSATIRWPQYIHWSSNGLFFTYDNGIKRLY